MKSKVFVFAVALAIPLFALLVAGGVRMKMQHDWSTAVMNEPSAHDASGQLTDKAQSLLSLEDVCQSDPSQIGETCDVYSDLNTLSEYAIWSAVGTLAFFGLVAIAGFIARADRRLLLAFVPGMFLSMVVVAVLLVLNSGLLIASLYFLFSAFFSRIPIGIMFAIGLGAIVALFQMLVSLKSVVKRAEVTVIGKRLDPSSCPELAKMIEALCTMMKSLKPDHIIVGLDRNFFVTEADVHCIDGLLRGRTLYLSLPLSRILTVEELKGVLAHEFGHFVGLDTRFSRRFYPVYRGTSESLARLLAHAQSNGAQGIASLPAALMLMYFLESFSAAENTIGRDRELKADNMAATATNRHVIASALLKLAAYSPVWSAVDVQIVETLKSGKQLVNVSSLFALMVNDYSAQASFDGLADSSLPHPTDTHPPLGVRLSALMESVGSLEADARQASPHPPANELLGDYNTLEQELSDVENVLVNQRISLAPA